MLMNDKIEGRIINYLIKWMCKSGLYEFQLNYFFVFLLSKEGSRENTLYINIENIDTMLHALQRLILFVQLMLPVSILATISFPFIDFCKMDQLKCAYDKSMSLII